MFARGARCLLCRTTLCVRARAPTHYHTARTPVHNIHATLLHFLDHRSYK